MVWIKLDDQFAEHPKVVALSDAAFRMHVSAICYCGRHLTDGHIPRQVVARLTYEDDWRRLRDELTASKQLGRAPLWVTLPSGDFEIHDWLEYNKSAEKVQAERTSASIRDELRRHLKALDLSHKEKLSAEQVGQLPEHLQHWCIPTEHGFKVSAPTVTELLTADAALSANARPESAVSRQADTGLERDFDACPPELQPKLYGPVPGPVPEPDPDPEKAAAAAPEPAAASPAQRQDPDQAAAAANDEDGFAKSVGLAFGRAPTRGEHQVIEEWRLAGIPCDLACSMIQKEMERRRSCGDVPIRSIRWFANRIAERAGNLKLAITQEPAPEAEEPAFDAAARLAELRDAVPEHFGSVRVELERLAENETDLKKIADALEQIDERFLERAYDEASSDDLAEIDQTTDAVQQFLAQRLTSDDLFRATEESRRRTTRNCLRLPKLELWNTWNN